MEENFPVNCKCDFYMLDQTSEYSAYPIYVTTAAYIRSAVLTPVAARAYPLRQSKLCSDGNIDFSTVDFVYYQPQFTISLKKSQESIAGDFPPVTPFHFFTVNTQDGSTYRLAIGRPISVYKDTVLLQCWAKDTEMLTVTLDVPGVLRTSLDLVHIPQGYPPLPPPCTYFSDAIDNTWDLLPANMRLNGTLLFEIMPVGVQIKERVHQLEPIFADEIVQDVIRCEEEVRDGNQLSESGRGGAGETIVVTRSTTSV